MIMLYLIVFTHGETENYLALICKWITGFSAQEETLGIMDFNPHSLEIRTREQKMGSD